MVLVVDKVDWPTLCPPEVDFGEDSSSPPLLSPPSPSPPPPPEPVSTDDVGCIVDDDA